MNAVIRDPRYWLSLAALVGVIVVALLKGGGGSSATAAPTAVITAVATANATAPPDATAAAAARLDQKRTNDLATIAGVLEQYHVANGAYPSTHDEFGTVCNRAFDSGCQLLSISGKLPTTDGTYPYWWRSSGAAYTLFTRVETPLADNGCTVTTPPALAGFNLMCLNGGSR